VTPRWLTYQPGFLLTYQPGLYPHGSLLHAHGLKLGLAVDNRDGRDGRDGQQAYEHQVESGISADS
jgi:hypothetical protein